MLELKNNADETLDETAVLARPAGPSFQGDENCHGESEQQPLDDLDEAMMESFPCSDPPCYSHCHA